MGKILQGEYYAKASEKHWVVLVVIVATKELKRHFFLLVQSAYREGIVFSCNLAHYPFSFTVKSCEMKRTACVRTCKLAKAEKNWEMWCLPPPA